MVCLNSDLDLASDSISESSVVPTFNPLPIELQHFQTWLQKYHPGFCNLPLSKQFQQCSRFLSIFIHKGILPPLPLPDSRIRLHPGKYALPLPPLQNLRHNFNTQLIRSFFQDPKFSNYTRIVFNTVHQSLISNQIDSLVCKFLVLSLTETADHLDAIYHLHLGLISHSLQYYLLKTNLAHSDITSILNATTQIFLHDGYRLLSILFNPDFLETFIHLFDSFLLTVPPDLKSLVASTIRLSCSLDSIFDMIDDRLYSLFSKSSTPWTNFHVDTLFSDPPSDTDGFDTSHDHYQNSRISNLRSLSRPDTIQLFLRLFVPDTTILFQGSIHSLSSFLTDLDSDFRAPFLTPDEFFKPVPSKCTHLHLQILDL